MNKITVARANVRKWIKNNSTNLGVATIFVSMCAVVFVAWTNPESGDDRPARPHITECAVNNPSEPCWSYDTPNGWYLEFNHGQAVYVPRTGDLINWGEPSAK